MGRNYGGERSIHHVMKARGEGDSLSAFARAVELDIHLKVHTMWAPVMLMFVAAPRPHLLKPKGSTLRLVGNSSIKKLW